MSIAIGTLYFMLSENMIKAVRYSFGQLEV